MKHQKLYYKATRDNGVSGHDPNFKYGMGINVHHYPDRRSKKSCGEGIHLAKALTYALKYVPQATEFYLAEAGVILGEDKEKLRCASCKIIKRIPPRHIARILAHEEESIRRREEELKQESELRQQFGKILDNGCLCGKEWLMSNLTTVTQQDIDNCRLEVTTDKLKFSISLKMKVSDRLALLRLAK